MSGWEFTDISLKVGNDQDVELVKQAMECMDYSTTMPLTSYEYYGGEGPRWEKKKDDIILCYDDCGKVDVRSLCAILNSMFENVDMYIFETRGNTVADCYFGEEITYNIKKRTYVQRVFDYCYYDNTVFGKKLGRELEDDESLDKIGSKVTKGRFGVKKFLRETVDAERIEEFVHSAKEDQHEQLAQLFEKVLHDKLKKR